MKTNITLKIDADLVREAKVLAAQQGTSVSRLLAEHLEELVRRDKAYDVAKRRALARLKKGFRLGWAPPASRHELHER
ncbi:MAG: DUF6364 family protein [Acidobacteriota bacterium]